MCEAAAVDRAGAGPGRQSLAGGQPRLCGAGKHVCRADSLVRNPSREEVRC